MYIYIYTFTYIHIPAHAHAFARTHTNTPPTTLPTCIRTYCTYAHMRVWTCIHACIRSCTHTHRLLHMFMYIHTYIHIHIHVHIHIHIHVHVHVHVNVHLYIHIHMLYICTLSCRTPTKSIHRSAPVCRLSLPLFMQWLLLLFAKEGTCPERSWKASHSSRPP